MASQFYNVGLLAVGDGRVDLDTTTLKIALTKTTYTLNPDTDFVDDGSADDITSKELVATNYAGGFAGAGRKTATITGQVNDTNNRADFAIADLTWTALGGATNDTIGTAELIREITNDAASLPISSFDVTDTPTNGGDITLDFLALGSGGNLRFAA